MSRRSRTRFTEAEAVAAPPDGRARFDWPVMAVLFLLTALLYASTLRHDFLETYDDPFYVTSNPQVLKGLTWEGVRWAATSVVAANWHPVTVLSHMLDVQLYGLNAAGHHATNVLSTLFWLLTTLAYLRYTADRTVRRMALVAVLLALGLMSKAMLVALPFTLLLLDYWPLGRLPRNLRDTATYRALFPLVREKWPLFALVVGSAAATVAAQRAGGAVVEGGLPLWPRLTNAVVSYVSYLRLTVWPSGLALFYPHPVEKLPLWQAAASLAVIVAVSVLVLRWAARKPYLPVGWFWYLGTLVPVIGIVQVGGQALATRYTYIPLIGIFVMVAWGVPDALARFKRSRATLAAGAAAVLAALAAVTAYNLPFWRNDETVWRHALAVTEDNFVAHINLGVALREQGRHDEALRHFQEVVRLQPRHEIGYLNMADTYLEDNQLDKAVEWYEQALSVAPDHVPAHYKAGASLASLGRLDEAAVHLRRAVELDPEQAGAHHELAGVLDRQGQTQEAAVHHGLALKYGGAEAVQRMSQDVGGQVARARGLAAEGKLDEAAAIYQEILQAAPDNVDVRNNLANTRARQGRYEEAAREFEETLRLQPDNPTVHYNLGHVYLRMNRRDDALRHFDEAVRLKPDFTRAKQDAARLRTP